MYTHMLLKKTCHSDSDRVISHIILNTKQAQDFPGVSPHYCFVGGVKFSQGEGSAVFHCTALQICDLSALYLA